MRRFGPIVALLLGVGTVATEGGHALSATPRHPPSSVPQPIAIGRIRVEVVQGRALVTTDVTMPAGRPIVDDLDVHVAYASPGIPLGFDAQLLPTPKGYLVAPADAVGVRLAHASAPRSPVHAAFCLGRADMAGNVVHIPGPQLSEGLASSGQVTIRLREVRELPRPFSDGTREMLVRLGSYRGGPLVVGLLELVSDVPISTVDATLCGPHSKGARVFVAGQASGGMAAPLVQRTAEEDLCLRFGSARKSMDGGLERKPPSHGNDPQSR